MLTLNTGRKIGSDAPCFIIAEIGANHNRSLTLAKEMIDAAAEAGADAAKFQIYSAETLYSRKTPRHSGYDRDLFDLIKEIETPRIWLPELADYCAKIDAAHKKCSDTYGGSYDRQNHTQRYLNSIRNEILGAYERRHLLRARRYARR